MITPEVAAQILLQGLTLANKVFDSIPQDMHDENWRRWGRFLDDCDKLMVEVRKGLKLDAPEN